MQRVRRMGETPGESARNLEIAKGSVWSAEDRCLVQVQCTVSLGAEVTSYMVASSECREMYLSSECECLSAPDWMERMSPLQAGTIESVFVSVASDLKAARLCC